MASQGPFSCRFWLADANIMFNVELYGRGWKGKRHDYSWLEGMIFILEWYCDIAPSSHKRVVGTTRLLAMNRRYTIPFKSEKIDELKKYFRTLLSCIVTGFNTFIALSIHYRCIFIGEVFQLTLSGISYRILIDGLRSPVTKAVYSYVGSLHKFL